jgi:hypothetical protein
MLGIIRKDIRVYVIYALLTAPGAWLLTYEDGMTRGTVLMLSLAMWLSVLLAASRIEVEEHLANGYRFLGTLPVAMRELVLAKHLLPLGFTALHVVYGFVFLQFAPVEEQFLRLSRGYLVLMGIACLLASGAQLYLVYRFGLPGLANIVVMAGSMSVVFLLIAGQVAVLRWAREGLTAEDIRLLADLASWPNLGLIAWAGLFAYVLMITASIKAKSAREA